MGRWWDGGGSGHSDIGRGGLRYPRETAAEGRKKGADAGGGLDGSAGGILGRLAQTALLLRLL